VSNRRRASGGEAFGSGVTDPRRVGGNIAGPGGPHDNHGVVLDVTRAVLLDYTEVALVEVAARDDDGAMGPMDRALAVMLAGRINRTDERARVLFITNGDGAAGIVTELLALAGRLGPEFEEAFMARISELADGGNDRPGPGGPA